MAKKTEAKPKRRPASQAEIDHAEWLYCEKNMTPEAIAKEMDRNIKTIYAWRDNGNWDETRELFHLGPTKLKKILTEAAIRIAKGEKRVDEAGNELKEIDADAIIKVMKSREYLNKGVSPEACRDFLIELDNFISEHDPELAAKNTQYHKMFLIQKIQEDGGN